MPTDDQSRSSTYECTNCGHRVTSDTRPGDCPECGGFMQNISKPRE